VTTISFIAKHLKELYFGKNWTGAAFPDVMEGIDWRMATKQREGLNSIATLVCHMHFYVIAIIDGLNNATSLPPDNESFKTPPIDSEEDWIELKQQSLDAVTKLLELLHQLPDSKLPEVFVKEEYGSYYRNIQGMIEHTHYHLGQIMMLKKL